MSAFYNCIMCHHANISIMDLHNHHIHHHNVTELSQAIINLKGFIVYNDIRHAKQKCLKPINLGDKNNNDDLDNHIFTKPELQNHNINNEQITNTPRKCSHDKTTCSINCRQFIAWEHELNKRTEINDEEFFNIIESLCYDLSRKKRRGRKKKDRTYMNNIATRNIIHDIQGENNMESKNITVDKGNTESVQIPTTSFWGSHPTVTNKVTTDEGLVNEIQNKIEQSTTQILAKSDDTVKNVPVRDSLYNTFSWNSIIVESVDQHDLLSDEENIYTESMEPTIENLLS